MYDVTITVVDGRRDALHKLLTHIADCLPACQGQNGGPYVLFGYVFDPMYVNTRGRDEVYCPEVSTDTMGAVLSALAGAATTMPRGCIVVRGIDRDEDPHQVVLTPDGLAAVNQEDIEIPRPRPEIYDVCLA